MHNHLLLDFSDNAMAEVHNVNWEGLGSKDNFEGSLFVVVVVDAEVRRILVSFTDFTAVVPRAGCTISLYWIFVAFTALQVSNLPVVVSNTMLAGRAPCQFNDDSHHNAG